MPEYFLTFGQRYRRELHPTFPEAHPDGYVAIIAESRAAAMSFAYDEFTGYYSQIYEEEEFDRSYYPSGNLKTYSLPGFNETLYAPPTAEVTVPGMAQLIDLITRRQELSQGVLRGEVERWYSAGRISDEERQVAFRQIESNRRQELEQIRTNEARIMATSEQEGTQENTPEVREGVDIMERAVLVTLDLTRIGTTRKVSSEIVNSDSDKAMINVSKKLYHCDELDAIGKLDGDIRTYLSSVTLPSVIKANFYLLPLASVERVDKRLNDYRTARIILVEAFIENYQGILQESEMRLGELFKPTDYYQETPSLRGVFTMQWAYTTFNVPDALQEISPAIFNVERQKAKQRWHEAAEEVQQVMRLQFSDLVDRMKDRLTPDASGKKKVFRNSLVGNMQSFLNEFDALNLTDDEALSELVQQARNIVEGVNPDDLRTGDQLREKIGQDFSEISERMSDLIQDKPLRAVEGFGETD